MPLYKTSETIDTDVRELAYGIIDEHGVEPERALKGARSIISAHEYFEKKAGRTKPKANLFLRITNESAVPVAALVAEIQKDLFEEGDSLDIKHLGTLPRTVPFAGTHLVREACQWAMEKGATCAHFDALNNVYAPKFYKRCGFEVAELQVRTPNLSTVTATIDALGELEAVQPEMVSL